MPEEIKEKIIKLLENNPNQKYSIYKIRELLLPISYPSILKWVQVLQAENKVKIEDYGNIKLVSLKDDLRKEELYNILKDV